MIVFRFLLVGGESITIGGERIIRGVFCETSDICPLCSVFLWYAVVWYFCICVICPGKRASLRRSEPVNDDLTVCLLVFTGRRRAQITQKNADLFSFKTINDLRSSASSAKSVSGNINIATHR